jgi:hypothetical protein
MSEEIKNALYILSKIPEYCDGLNDIIYAVKNNTGEQIQAVAMKITEKYQHINIKKEDIQRPIETIKKFIIDIQNISDKLNELTY